MGKKNCLGIHYRQKSMSTESVIAQIQFELNSIPIYIYFNGKEYRGKPTRIEIICIDNNIFRRNSISVKPNIDNIDFDEYVCELNSIPFEIAFRLDRFLLLSI